MRNPLFLFACLGLLASASSEASCPDYQRRLDGKLRRSRGLLGQERALATAVTTVSQACAEKGETLSQLVAQAASAGSCTALSDASGLDRKLEALGKNCVARLGELRKKHRKAYFRFRAVEASHSYANQALHQLGAESACPAEAQFSARLEGSLLTETPQLIKNENLAIHSVQDYGRFVAAAAALEKLSGKSGRDCNQIMGSVKATLGKALAPTMPGGKHRRPASTITGIKPKP